jgi:exopolyphosphatase / guanosine-5'-triphosphate,3'-diphosphate pyrophosphatase
MPMAKIKPRYEFRVWAENLSPLREKLEGLAQPRETVSKETYLISAMTDRCNAKIRSGLMDVKILIHEDRGLEQWSPILKAGFPLDRSVIAGKVFPSLEVPTPRLLKSEYAMEEFLHQVIPSDRRIAVVDVSKTRYQFAIGVCQAEFASTTVNQVPRETVAIESTDADAVLQLIQDLGITEPNTSYIREIKRVLGLAAV